MSRYFRLANGVKQEVDISAQFCTLYMYNLLLNLIESGYGFQV